jgi:leucyl-tRNA synthetase
MILGEDGEKMSKSRGNVINPDDMVSRYGADALRVYLMFMGPLERDKPWQDTGIEGVRRFLDRVWRLVWDEPSQKIIADDSDLSPEIEKLMHKTIKKVTEDIETLSFNTAISAMMILVNEVYKTEARPKLLLKTLAQLLMPFAPHLSEEIWNKLGGSGLVSVAPWPKFDPKLVEDDTIEMGVQVNGKTRGTVTLAKDAAESDAVTKAQELATVQNALKGLKIIKVIYKPGKILNLIAK